MKVRYVPDLEASERQLRVPGPGGPATIRAMTIKYVSRYGVEAVRSGADLVHGFGADAPGIDLDVLTIFIPCPVHELGPRVDWWASMNRLMSDSMARSRHVIATSNFTARWCRWVTKTPVTMIEQGYDPEMFPENLNGIAWRERLGCGDRPLVLWPKCGADESHDIGPTFELARRHPDFVFVAPLKQKFAAAPANFHQVGPQLPAEFKMLLAACDVFLGTNIEGGSVAHCEAMHLGKPILSYAWGGDYENSCGICVSPGDIEGLDTGLLKILSDYDAFSAAARIYVRSLRIERTIPRLLAIYDRLRRP